MRYSTMAIALAALAAAAPAQTSNWGTFEANGGAGVGLAAANGAQLLIKCDKPGKGSVYAAVATPSRLVPPSSTFTMRPVKYRFDAGPIEEDRWRFYQQTAAAVNTTSERSLSRFLAGLAEAKSVKVTMEPGNRTPNVDESFDVTGAKEAIAQAYAACKDEMPAK